MRRKPGAERRKIDWKAVRQRLDEALVRFEADGAITDDERLLRAQRARILARAELPEALVVTGLELLEFTVRGRPLAIESRVVIEVLRDTSLSLVPGAGRGLVGVASRRGLVIPVFDLGTTLALPAPDPAAAAAASGASRRIVLVGVSQVELGLLVDSVEGLTACAPESLAAIDGQEGGAPDSLWKGVTPGGCRVLDGTAVLLDRRFFAAPSQRKGEA